MSLAARFLHDDHHQNLAEFHFRNYNRANTPSSARLQRIDVILRGPRAGAD